MVARTEPGWDLEAAMDGLAVPDAPPTRILAGREADIVGEWEILVDGRSVPDGWPRMWRQRRLVLGVERE